MSKLIWDAVGAKKYENGVDHGVFYPYANSVYGEGVAWNGLTAVNETPSGGEANDIYADNIKYASLRSAETFGATIEAYTYPDEFAECDGSAELTTGVLIGQQERKMFGFSYRTMEGDDSGSSSAKNYKIHLIYGCTVSPSEKAYQTINDSPDAITFSWELESTPVPVTGLKPTASLVIDCSKLSDAQVTAIENALYGTDAAGSQEATTGTLPLPDQVKTIITGAAA